MKKEQFTPGPWVRCEDHSVWEEKTGAEICGAYLRDGTICELSTVPNLDLIAASPLLYDALRDCWNTLIEVMPVSLRGDPKIITVFEKCERALKAAHSFV